jgi:hypothetical protein
VCGKIDDYPPIAKGIWRWGEMHLPLNVHVTSYLQGCWFLIQQSESSIEEEDEVSEDLLDSSD